MMGSVKFAALTALAVLATQSAMAADLPSVMQPGIAMPMPPVMQAAPIIQPAPMMAPQAFASGWYLRGDIGVSSQQVQKLDNLLYNLPPAPQVTAIGHGFDGAGFVGAGIGYDFNGWFRTDITAEYRSKANYHGLDIYRYPSGATGTDEYSGSLSSFVVLANIYADLGTWWCLTPFIGAGFGGAYNTISSFTDVNTPNAGVAYGATTSKFNFAYALHAGVGYRATQNLTIELAYRYLNLGDAASGDLITYTGVNNYVNPMEFKNLTSHDIKLGVRWNCCDDLPPPPPPQPILMRRG